MAATNREHRQGISRRELARRLGVSEAVIRRYISAGKLSDAIFPDNSIDAEKAVEQLRGLRMKGGHAPATLTAARAAKLRAQLAIMLDELYDLRSEVVRPHRAAKVYDHYVAQLVPYYRSIADAAPRLCGTSGQTAHNILRAAWIGALEKYQADLAERQLPEKAPRVVPDLDAMSASELETLKVRLETERLKIRHAVDRGTLVRVDDEADKFVERIGAAKSLMMAIPSRIAGRVENASAAEIQAMLELEIDGIIAVASGTTPT